MDSLSKGWFSELGTMWPGQCFSIECAKDGIVFNQRSKYQDILVFDSVSHGRVLALDGVIQLTEKDECSYQEMMTHIPMCSHPCPEKVLIIGGGDGGIVREVVKHECVKEVQLVDIDAMVIEVAKKYIPQTGIGFASAKVKVHIADGVEFLKDHVGEFDVIICDSSDPVGPAEVLFEESFFVLAMAALKDENGILCTQCESVWLHLKVIKQTLDYLRKMAAVVEYAWTSVPSYPSGTIGFALARNGKGTSSTTTTANESSDASTFTFKKPLRPFEGEGEHHYYSSDLHEASFVLPAFVSKALDL